MCDLFITTFSRLKILTFINEKKFAKKKKRKDSGALKHEAVVSSQSTGGN